MRTLQLDGGTSIFSKENLMRIKLGKVALLATMSFSTAATAQPRLTTTVEAPVQQYPSVAGAWIDPAALGGSAAPATVEFKTVSVRPADAPGAPALPARIDADNGAYRILWQVPAAGKGQAVGTTQPFQVEVGGKASPALEQSRTNLIYNGDFSQVNAKGVPEGFSARGFPTEFRIAEEDGNRFLSFNADAEGRGTFWSPLTAVQPGKSYVFSFRYRVKAGKPHSRYNLDFYSYIYFLDAHQKPLTPPRVGAARAKTDTDGWQTFETTLAIPAGGQFTRFALYNGNTVPDAVAVDDLRIAPAALAEVTSLRTATGKEIETVAQSPQIRRFDLGPAKSQVWPGYTALTPEDKYDAAKGYGFTRLAAISAMDTTRPEALTRDFISARDARLRVDLPQGKYRLWFITGDSQVGSTVQRLYFDSALNLNGKEVYKSDETPVAFFSKGGGYWRFYRAFWTPGMDYYDTFIAPHFQTHAFDAEVTGDHLEIQWRNLPVNAILIAPADQAQAMEREMAALTGQRRRATRIVETPGPKEPMPRVSDAEQQRGYVLFRRPASDIIYPSSRPRPGEQITQIQAFAAPGQYQTVHFSLLPLKDLGAVSVRAGELKTGSASIAASAVDVRVARYIFQEVGRVRHIRADYNYQIASFPLDHHDSVPGKTGLTWSWWATIKVPDDAAPGIYEGALTITPEHGQAFDLPVRLRVVPLKLEALPIVQGDYYFPSEPWYSAFWGANLNGPSYRNDPAIRKIIVENETRELAFMKRIGFNSVAFGDDLRGDWEEVDGQVRLKKDNRFTLWMDIYAKAKMGPMPFYGFQPIGMANRLGSWFPKDFKQPFTDKWIAAYRSTVTTTQELAKERGWPEILWYISDEASNEGQKGAELALKCAKLLKGLPGIRTIASMNGPWEHILPPALDISMPNIAFPITEETVKLIRDSGSKLWLYNCGDDRLMLGLYPWRLDAGGRFQWHYRSMVANPWDDLDGTYGETAYTIALPGPDGPVPCLPAQTMRAAINDHRYIATLESAIAAAKDNPEKQKTVAQARAFLEDLHRRIPVDARVLVGYKIDPRETGAAVGGEFKNTDALDRVRWAATEYILDLQK